MDPAGGETPLKVYWFGYGGSSYLAEELRPLIQSLGMTLTTVHEWDTANVKWQRSTWLEEIKKADIIIIPTNYTKQPAKSNNRLTQSMAIGKPVVCSPLDSYLRIEKENPGCCLFAKTAEEWRDCLTKLKDEQFRKAVSERALEASKKYSVEAIGTKWLKLFTNFDSVDIIIPTYNNPECLKLCVESIRACTDDTYQIIVVNNGTNEETDKYLSDQKDIRHLKTGRLNFSQAINKGIEAGSSTYVCLLNDDTIVSKGWMRSLLTMADESIGVQGVLSNCDKGWLHTYDLKVAGVDLLPGVNTLEQIRPIIPQLYDGVKNPGPRFIDREWVAFYCVLIPRKIIEKVGILDEGFTNSGEDVDYCRRVRKMGYKVVQNYESFVFHFGAVGRKILESEDKGSYQKADQKTQSYLKDKWGKESVVIYTGPSWERWDFRNVDAGGIGGSETWAVWLARELAKLNYRVTVFADCPESGAQDGSVRYLHYTQYPGYIEQNWIDYFVSSRTTDPFDLPVRCGKAFVQIHDVWLLSDKDKLYLDKVNKFCALSHWHKDFVKGYHKIPEDKLCLTFNGIDFTRFDAVQVERNPYRLHWSSSLDRGLDNVLYLWPHIKKEIPQAELHVFYGTYNWRKNAEQKNDKEALKKIDALEEQMKQPGVFDHGRIGQKELAVEWKKASLLLYPSWFSESFFIGGIEAQRAGVPVIANKYAGVTTTLGDSAILLGNGDAWWPYTQEGREKFLQEALSILKDRKRWQEWSDRGFANSEKYSWSNVAKRWVEIFKS